MIKIYCMTRGLYGKFRYLLYRYILSYGRILNLNYKRYGRLLNLPYEKLICGRFINLPYLYRVDLNLQYIFITYSRF